MSSFCILETGSHPEWPALPTPPQGMPSDPDPSLTTYPTTTQNAQTNRDNSGGRYEWLLENILYWLEVRYQEKHFRNYEWSPGCGFRIYTLLVTMLREGYFTSSGFDLNYDELKWRLGGGSQIKPGLLGGDTLYRGDRIYMSDASGVGDRYLIGTTPPAAWEGYEGPYLPSEPGYFI